MNAAELKLARAIAQDLSVNLAGVAESGFNRLVGFGCEDFEPCSVSLLAIARMMRYQCLFFSGDWDEKQYNEDIQFFRRRVQVADLTRDEAFETVRDLAARMLSAAV